MRPPVLLRMHKAMDENVAEEQQTTTLRNNSSREEEENDDDDDDDTLRCPTCRNAFREIRMSRTKEVKYKRRLVPPKRRRRRRRPRETKEERKTRREKERKEGERKDFSDDEEEDLTSSSCAEDDDEEEEEEEEEEGHFCSGQGPPHPFYHHHHHACSVCREFDAEDGGVLLLCDGCERAMHPLCVGFEEATYVPEGDFLCPECHRVAMRQAASVRPLPLAHLGRGSTSNFIPTDEG